MLGLGQKSPAVFNDAQEFADAGAGLGVFEELHGESNGADFSKRIDQAAKRYYGTAWIAFIERLISDRGLAVTR